MKKHLTTLTLSLITIISLTSCSSKSVDINKYAKYESVGFNNFGQIEAQVDYEAIANLSKEGNDKKMRAIYEATNYPPYTLMGDTNLKNGDKTTIRWKKDKKALKYFEETLKIKLKAPSDTIEVKSLISPEKYNPFLDVKYKLNNPMSKSGDIEFYIEQNIGGKKEKLKVEHNAKNGKIKNGDKLHLKLASSIDKDLWAREEGLLIDRTSDDIIVDFLHEPIEDKNIFKYIGERERKTFDKVIEAWVVSGINDMQNLEGNRTYKPCGYIYAKGEKKDLLGAIYSVYDPSYSSTYYTYIALEDKFYHNDKGLFIDQDKPLPSTYMQYEKEKERRGVSYEGELINIHFAGHDDIKEVVEHIKKTHDYKTYHYDDLLNTYLTTKEEE